MVRLKNRYILFEVLHPSTEALALTQRQLIDLLRDEIALNFGKHGSGLLAASLHCT
jgi:RNase P/RNase MRP subunit POP5